MTLTFFDATDHLDNDELRSMLALAADLDDEDDLDALAERYAEEDRARLIGAVDAEERLMGLIGLDMMPGSSARLRHLFVRPGMRRQGIGRALVERAVETLKPATLEGRCPEDLLPFFSALGFGSRIAGAVPPGRVVYGIRLERPAG